MSFSFTDTDAEKEHDTLTDSINNSIISASTAPSAGDSVVQGGSGAGGVPFTGLPSVGSAFASVPPSHHPTGPVFGAQYAAPPLSAVESKAVPQDVSSGGETLIRPRPGTEEGMVGNGSQTRAFGQTGLMAPATVGSGGRAVRAELPPMAQLEADRQRLQQQIEELNKRHQEAEIKLQQFFSQQPPSSNKPQPPHHQQQQLQPQQQLSSKNNQQQQQPEHQQYHGKIIQQQQQQQQQQQPSSNISGQQAHGNSTFRQQLEQQQQQNWPHGGNTYHYVKAAGDAGQPGNQGDVLIATQPQRHGIQGQGSVGNQETQWNASRDQYAGKITEQRGYWNISANNNGNPDQRTTEQQPTQVGHVMNANDKKVNKHLRRAVSCEMEVNL